MVKIVMSTVTMALAAADELALLQASVAINSKVKKHGDDAVICVQAAAGDVAPVAGSFTPIGQQLAVVVVAGSVASEAGSFCFAKTDALLIQRTFGFHTARDLDVPPDAQNFATFDFAGDTQKKVMVEQCPDKSGTLLTQTMEATVSKKGNEDNMRVCACRDFLKRGLGLRNTLDGLAYQRVDNGVQLGAYPGYSGDLRFTGDVKASITGDHQGNGRAFVKVDYDLKGFEDACKEGAPIKGNACGIHIHEGKTCDDHDALGNRRSRGVYITQNGIVTGQIIGRSEDIAGRAMVVTDSTGERVACALLPTLAIPNFRTECIKADTLEKRTSMAKMINNPTQVVSYTATYQSALPSEANLTANLTGWERCSKAWIVEGACAEIVHPTS